MPNHHRVWIQCFKQDAQSVKEQLKATGKFDREGIVQAKQTDGLMLIPTTVCHDPEVAECPQGPGSFGIEPGLVKGEICALSLPTAAAPPRDRSLRTDAIRGAASSWLESLPDALRPDVPSATRLIAQVPKRWSSYVPMLLLPVGAFQDPSWVALLGRVDSQQREALWRTILQAAQTADGGAQPTHIAVNAAIPRQAIGLDGGQGRAAPDENILRRPSDLVPLYGDFGPELSPGPTTREDLDAAFWVAVRQNGIWQTWAPRHTMFSRGNVKEKARILGFSYSCVPSGEKRTEEASPGVGRESRGKLSTLGSVAVDLYAGIGYFAFSYARLDVEKVLCWEINPWSVEGLRRGAERNGWGCKIVHAGDEIGLEEVLGGNGRLVVFEETNENALSRVAALRRRERGSGMRLLGDIIHVNCGLLPTSEPCWKSAWSILCKAHDAWMHLHENVGEQDIQKRAEQIRERFDSWAVQEGGLVRVDVEHVELVKTFAPGVWHCVFDVHVAVTTSSPQPDTA